MKRAVCLVVTPTGMSYCCSSAKRGRESMYVDTITEGQQVSVRGMYRGWNMERGGGGDAVKPENTNKTEFCRTA